MVGGSFMCHGAHMEPRSLTLYDDVLGGGHKVLLGWWVTAGDAPRDRVWELPAYLGRPLLPAPPWPPIKPVGRGGSFECTAWP